MVNRAPSPEALLTETRERTWGEIESIHTTLDFAPDDGASAQLYGVVERMAEIITLQQAAIDALIARVQALEAPAPRD